jgi:hypothetical protein
MVAVDMMDQYHSSITKGETRGRRSSSIPEEDKMAKLLRERSTAQKRRQCKREELTQLSSAVQEYELKICKLQSFLSNLSEHERRLVLAAQARAGNPPVGCRLCSILERREEFSTPERLMQHLRMHHASEVRNRADDFELLRFGMDIPSEDAILSDSDENDSDDESMDFSHEAENNSSSELKRKIRLKRNAASARKSRKRKRVQMERWRMMLPMVRFQADTLEAALKSVAFAPPPQHPVAIQSFHPSMILPQSVPAPPRFDAEPDVVSAAFALIGCSLLAQRTKS